MLRAFCALESVIVLLGQKERIGVVTLDNYELALERVKQFREWLYDARANEGQF